MNRADGWSRRWRKINKAARAFIEPAGRFRAQLLGKGKGERDLRMGKIRINELARELEVKSNVVMEYLAGIGHSGQEISLQCLDDDLADKVRAHFRADGESATEKVEAAPAAPVPPPAPCS